MPFKPNYRGDRTERTRQKQAKKLEKLQKREDQTAQRRAGELDTQEHPQRDHDNDIESKKEN